MAPVTEKDKEKGGASSGNIEDEFEMFEMDEDLGDGEERLGSPARQLRARRARMRITETTSSPTTTSIV